MNKFIIIFIKLICFFATLFSLKFTKKNYIFFKCCLKYFQYYHFLDKKCLSCPREVIFNGLKILSSEDTLDEIIKNNRSISSFGDGEFNLIFGKKIGFQEVNKTLIKKLKKVLKCKKKGLLIGIFLPYKNNYLEQFIYVTKKYLIKLIWEKRDILIIEGEKSRLGIGNDLFNNSKSIKRILCPAENAFNVYDKILEHAKKIDKSFLILLALGPTSSILAYDLYKLGYQVIDAGHIDIEYEWYLRKATKRISIDNKYVNEISGNKFKFGHFNDTKYNEEIISTIKN